MWKCSHCGEENERNFTLCWSCRWGKDGTPPDVDDSSDLQNQDDYEFIQQINYQTSSKAIQASAKELEPQVAESLFGKPYSGSTWEYLLAEFIYTAKNGWQLASVNGQEMATKRVPIPIASFTKQAGQHGWELVSSTLSFGERLDSSAVTFAKASISKTDVTDRILFTFMRPEE